MLKQGFKVWFQNVITLRVECGFYYYYSWYGTEHPPPPPHTHKYTYSSSVVFLADPSIVWCQEQEFEVVDEDLSSIRVISQEPIQDTLLSYINE